LIYILQDTVVHKQISKMENDVVRRVVILDTSYPGVIFKSIHTAMSQK